MRIVVPFTTIPQVAKTIPIVLVMLQQKITAAPITMENILDKLKMALFMERVHLPGMMEVVSAEFIRTIRNGVE